MFALFHAVFELAIAASSHTHPGLSLCSLSLSFFCNDSSNLMVWIVENCSENCSRVHDAHVVNPFTSCCFCFQGCVTRAMLMLSAI